MVKTQSHQEMKERRIRIGKIDFTNVWPIYYHFPIEELKQRVEVILQVPTGLNRAMKAGEIDMGPISSFAYGESFQDYLLYPDLSVSALNKVKSIYLFYKKPFERLLEGRIALPTTSATSVNLLRIILEKFYGGKPHYSYASPSLHDMMETVDGALLIGDDAIKANWANRDYEVMDLGEKWHQVTGQWMSFAVWAIRKEAAERYPDLVEQIFSAFLRSKEHGLKYPERMIRAAMAQVGGTYGYWESYFGNLCYDFGPEQRQGLELYFRYAYELGLLSKEVVLQMWTNNKVAQVEE